jgi:hypothetical protein
MKMEIKTKAYECGKCGKEEEHETNHWGNIYNVFCSVCDTIREWKVSEEIPEDGWVPHPWTNHPIIGVDEKTVKLEKVNFPFFKLAVEDADKNRKKVFAYGGIVFATNYAKSIIEFVAKDIAKGKPITIVQPQKGGTE